MAGAAEAEDLTQETFLRVNHALEGFRGDAALATWIYRIATNVATDRLRTPGFQLGVRSAEPEALAVLATVPVIEQDIARREMSECVRGYIDQLPAEAAKIRLHRARARLRQMFEQGCDLSRDERNELTCEPRPGDVSSTA